jgi:hypothetical protein
MGAQEGAHRVMAGMGPLEAKLTVGGLAASLPMLTVAVTLQFESSGSAELVDVAAGKAGAVSAVPVLFEKHRTLTPRAAARGSSLHRAHLPS